MDEVIVEREEMIALNPEKDREQQKRKKWRSYSGCYKITILFLMGVLLSAFLCFGIATKHLGLGL